MACPFLWAGFSEIISSLLDWLKFHTLLLASCRHARGGVMVGEGLETLGYLG